MNKFKNLKIHSPSNEINTEPIKNILSLNRKIGALEMELQKKDEIIAKLEKQGKNDCFCVPDVTRYDISIDEILTLKQNGLSNVKMARQLGCSEGTIRNRILQSKNKGC